MEEYIIQIEFGESGETSKKLFLNGGTFLKETEAIMDDFLLSNKIILGLREDLFGWISWGKIDYSEYYDMAVTNNEVILLPITSLFNDIIDHSYISKNVIQRNEDVILEDLM